MFLRGIAGLLQMTVLPGWLWLRVTRVRTRNPWEELLYCFAASLIVNQWIVYVLTAVGENKRGFWTGIMAAEALALLVTAYMSTMTSAGTRNVPGQQIESPEQNATLISVGLGALAIVSIFAFVPVFRENWGTVFVSNDDVASWDRWAMDWFLNRWPIAPQLYPQLLPANWSITYALMGTSDVKMFAKAIMPMFPLGILLLFVSLARLRNNRAFLAGCSIAGLLLFQYLGRDFLMTGYVDVALAFFSFLASYVLYQDPATIPREAMLLALFFATGAALTKQGGLLVLAAVAVYLLTIRATEAGQPVSRALRWSAWLSLAFVALWYIPKFYAAMSGGSNLGLVLHDVHQGRGYLDRIWFGCRLFIDAGGNLGRAGLVLFAAAIVGGLLVSSARRITLGIVLPGFLLWGMFFSYEIRTAAFLFPFVGLIGGIVLGHLGAYVLGKLRGVRLPHGQAAYWTTGLLMAGCGLLLYYSGEAVPRIRANYTWPAILVGVGALLAATVQITARLPLGMSLPGCMVAVGAAIGLAAWPAYPDSRLMADQLNAQRLIGNPAVNARLYKLRDDGQLNQPVVSNYWYLASLPEIGPLNRLLNCGQCTSEALLENIAARNDAGFLLTEDLFLPTRTVLSMGHCPGLETVFVEGTVRLFRLDRSRLTRACVVDPETIRPVIEKLYPPETLAAKGFNVQPSGLAAVGVACRNASRTSVIVWGGTELASVYGGPNALTAEVPGSLYSKPGHYAIEIWDKDTRLRSSPVEFEVK